MNLVDHLTGWFDPVKGRWLTGEELAKLRNDGKGQDFPFETDPEPTVVVTQPVKDD